MEAACFSKMSETFFTAALCQNPKEKTQKLHIDHHDDLKSYKQKPSIYLYFVIVNIWNRACSMNGIDEKCIQSFRWETWREKNT
jgi:hypothetical protein